MHNHKQQHRQYSLQTPSFPTFIRFVQRLDFFKISNFILTQNPLRQYTLISRVYSRHIHKKKSYTNTNKMSHIETPSDITGTNSTSPKNGGRKALRRRSSSNVKRLQSELMQLMMSGTSGVTAFPKGENLNEWTATIKGADKTVYEGLEYKLDMKFPADYPYSAPTVKFVTPCFHPNVDQYGNICLDILKDKWSAAYSVQTILVSLQSLLGGTFP